MQQRLLAWRENYRKGILLSIEFPTLRHTREFLPRFRPLDTEQLSLRLAGNNPQAYAKEIAYSPYISELNGDNRETYRHSIIQITQTIQAVMALIGE